MAEDKSIPPANNPRGAPHPPGSSEHHSQDATLTSAPSSRPGRDPEGAQFNEKLKISIPGYRLLAILGRGGQALVFKAVQESTGKLVAVKLLRGESIKSASARERFDREVRALSAINHPNIVGIIDTGQTRHGHGYLVMNYIAGQSLKQFMEDSRLVPDGALDPAAMLGLIRKICEAVNAAHMKGITHRDLSPSNVIIDAQSEPHIVDFGLARTAFDRFMTKDRQDISITGQFLGKLAYASPEQAQGRNEEIDIRTDVYALGVILYQLLTGGRFPYDVVGNIVDVLSNIVNVQPMPPSKLLAPGSATGSPPRVRSRQTAEVNPVIEAIVLKALEKNPADRYQTAGELAIDIDNYLSGRPTMAGKGKSAIAKPGFKRPVVLAASIVVVLGAASILVFRTRPAPQGVAISAETPIKKGSVRAPISRDTPSSGPKAPTAAESGVVNLLALTHLSNDRTRESGDDDVAGHWVRTQEGLRTDTPQKGKPAKLRLIRVPEGEYDFRVTFTPLSGSEGVAQILSLGGHEFAWFVGAPQARSSHFARFAQGAAVLNLQKSRPSPPLSNMDKHVAVVRVRHDSIRGLLDGVLLDERRMAGAWNSVDLMPGWQVGSGHLGITTYRPIILHSAVLIPTNGAGDAHSNSNPLAGP